MRPLIFGLFLLLLSACGSDKETCTPQCDDAICGDDSCGGSCGTCNTDQFCDEGVCRVEGCGDGAVGADETCDDSSDMACTPANYCVSTNACFKAVYTGSPETCDATCATEVIETCIDDDGCCAPGCNPENDTDCRPELCGNGVLDPRETCDPPEFPCPESCPNDDACMILALTGIPEACNAACRPIPISMCFTEADGCCPQNCGTTDDVDCATQACGNATLDEGEMCDSAIVWPLSGACSPDCEDNRACTQNSIAGAAETCSVMCSSVDITVCLAGDGCCPSGCTEVEDADCTAVMCGDGIVDGDEACDNTIPAGFPGFCATTADQCDDGNPCTTDTLEGDAADCSARCVNTPLACGGGDACCPSTCTTENDTECAALSLCDSYCDKAMLHCTGANEIFASSAACQTACATMIVGNPSDITGNTLYCRIHHLEEAAIDPDTHCPHGAEVPVDGCI